MLGSGYKNIMFFGRWVGYGYLLSYILMVGVKNEYVSFYLIKKKKKISMLK